MVFHLPSSPPFIQYPFIFWVYTEFHHWQDSLPGHFRPLKEWILICIILPQFVKTTFFMSILINRKFLFPVSCPLVRLEIDWEMSLCNDLTTIPPSPTLLEHSSFCDFIIAQFSVKHFHFSLSLCLSHALIPSDQDSFPEAIFPLPLQLPFILRSTFDELLVLLCFHLKLLWFARN